MDPHQVLVDLSSTAEERIQACFQLLVENSEESVKLLRTGLTSDPSPIVRHECAYSLGELSFDDGSTALIEAIKHDPNSFVVHEAALALSNLGVEQARDVLIPLLQHKDHDVALTANISLQRLDMKQKGLLISQIERSMEEIILDLHTSEEYRIQASFVLMEEGSNQSIDVLIKALKQETDPIVKHEIIFSLGETASHRVVPYLIDEMLNDPNPFVKHEAALALGTLGNPEAAEAIKVLLAHSNPDIVESAEIALERLLKS